MRACGRRRAAGGRVQRAAHSERRTTSCIEATVKLGCRFIFEPAPDVSAVARPSVGNIISNSWFSASTSASIESQKSVAWSFMTARALICLKSCTIATENESSCSVSTPCSQQSKARICRHASVHFEYITFTCDTPSQYRLYEMFRRRMHM